MCVCNHEQEAILITPRPICPSEQEIMLNPRAGSAKLRVAEKLAPGAAGVTAVASDEVSDEDAARLRYEAKRAARLARQGRQEKA